MFNQKQILNSRWNKDPQSKYVVVSGRSDDINRNPPSYHFLSLESRSHKVIWNYLNKLWSSKWMSQVSQKDGWMHWNVSHLGSSA